MNATLWTLRCELRAASRPVPRDDGTDHADCGTYPGPGQGSRRWTVAMRVHAAAQQQTGHRDRTFVAWSARLTVAASTRAAKRMQEYSSDRSAVPAIIGAGSPRARQPARPASEMARSGVRRRRTGNLDAGGELCLTEEGRHSRRLT